MRRYIHLVLFAAIGVFFICGAPAFCRAAMEEGSTSDDIVNAVVMERSRAKQEYEVYRARKGAHRRAAVITPKAVVNEPGIAYSKRKKNIIISIVLILVAAGLSLKLRQISKDKELP